MVMVACSGAGSDFAQKQIALFENATKEIQAATDLQKVQEIALALQANSATLASEFNEKNPDAAMSASEEESIEKAGTKYTETIQAKIAELSGN